MELTREAVLAELGKIGFADLSQVLAQGSGAVTFEALQALPPEVLGAVAALEKSAGGWKLKFYDKLRALELLGKAVGAFDSQPESDPKGSDLLRALLEATGREVQTDGIQELQPETAAGHDLVESPQAGGV